jgi:WD40 repeat protein
LGRARLYRLPDWEELLNLGELGGANSTNQLELVGDDRAVMTGLGKSLLQESRLWDLRPQPPRRLHEIPPGAIKSYQWSPDGKRFVVFHEDDLLFEFDRIGNLLQRVELPPSGPAARVAYGSDGRPFPADAGSIQVLGAVPRAAPIGDQPFVRLVGISPTGTTAWQSGKGLTLRRVDNAVLRTIVRDRAVSAVSWNRAENCILIAGDGAVDVIRLDVDQPSVTIVGQSEQAFFDPSETRLVVAGRKSAALHDRAGRQLLRIDAPDVESSLLFRWSPDAKWLVWMSKTGRMRLYNDAGAIVLEEPGTGGESPWTPSGIATWTPDVRTLYLDHRHGGPWIWRTGDSKLTKLLETRPYELVGAALSPDGGLLLVNARRGLELWPSEPLMEVAKRRLGYLEAKDRESFKR